MIRGRGTQSETFSRFHKQQVHYEPGLDPDDPEAMPQAKTRFVPVFPKTILNKVESPDIPMAWSLNPYQGCEHGCVYCYARPSHAYWDLNPGLDFESVILIKQNAVSLLREALHKPGWQAQPVMMAGNTDIYQPAERRFGLTRSLLEEFARFRHPVGLISKNALILRDLDLLADLARDQLVVVNLSLTTLSRDLKSKLEPRTSRPEKVLAAVRALADAGVPVRILFSPVIPSLNDHELMAVAEAARDAGAWDFGYQVVRLNGPLEGIFRTWAETHFPDRAGKVMRQIADLHGGQTQDSRFGVRMRGEGIWAEAIRRQYQIARKKFFPRPPPFSFNTRLFGQHRLGQLKIDFS